MPKGIRVEVTPRDEHDFMGKIMLQIPLKPSEQIEMPAYRYSFLDDSEVALKMINRE